MGYNIFFLSFLFYGGVRVVSFEFRMGFVVEMWVFGFFCVVVKIWVGFDFMRFLGEGSLMVKIIVGFLVSFVF